MITARLRVGEKGIDDIRIAVSGGWPTIMKLKGQRSALNLWRDLAKAYMAGREDPFTINIDGLDYCFPKLTWWAIFSVVDQWFECYLPAEYAELQLIIAGDSSLPAEAG
jgi:hypothetical protein